MLCSSAPAVITQRLQGFRNMRYDQQGISMQAAEHAPVTCWKKGIMMAMISSGRYCGRKMLRQGCMTCRAYCTGDPSTQPSGDMGWLAHSRHCSDCAVAASLLSA